MKGCRLYREEVPEAFPATASVILLSMEACIPKQRLYGVPAPFEFGVDNSSERQRLVARLRIQNCQARDGWRNFDSPMIQGPSAEVLAPRNESSSVCVCWRPHSVTQSINHLRIMRELNPRQFKELIRMLRSHISEVTIVSVRIDRLSRNKHVEYFSSVPCDGV